MNVRTVDGVTKLCCDGCGATDVPLDLAFKPDAMHLCRSCKKKNPCDLCGKLVRILTWVPGTERKFCSRCFRQTD